MGLGDVLAERGDIDEARAAYAHVARRHPADLRAVRSRFLTLPMVYRDAAELRVARARYAEGLTELENGLDRFVGNVAADELLDGLRWSNFFLAYQGDDDRRPPGPLCRVRGTRDRPGRSGVAGTDGVA